jgi:hypothetical protein
MPKRCYVYAIHVDGVRRYIGISAIPGCSFGSYGGMRPINVGPDLVLHYVTRNQSLVWIDENKLIALRVSRAEPQQPCRHATSEVQAQLSAEDFVWRAELLAGEQRFPKLVTAREHPDHILAVAVQLVLLDLVADQQSFRWETQHSGRWSG